MNTVVYMKFEQNILTKKDKLFLKEIAEISSSDNELENKIKMLSFDRDDMSIL